MKNSPLKPWRNVVALFVAAISISTRDSALRAEEPLTPWKRDISAGLTLTQGNSQTVLLNSKFDADKKWALHRVRLGGRGNYGENEGDTSHASASGYIQYDRTLSESWYAYSRFDAYHDAIANVQYDLNLGPGGGYYLIKNDRADWETGFNPSFKYREKNEDPEFLVAARAFQQLNFRLNEGVRLWQSTELLPNVRDFEDFVFQAEIGIESSLTETVKLRSSLENRFDNLPAPGRMKNDFKLITSIAYSF